MPGRNKALFLYWSIGCLLLGVLFAPIFHIGQPEDHSRHFNHEHSESHSLIEVNPLLVPEVSVHAIEDEKSGWNLVVETSNFTFTPENTNRRTVMNEGHAHIFVNGDKLGRLYGNYYHLSDFPPGEYEITVSLTSNEHSTFAVGGKAIVARAMITQVADAVVEPAGDVIAQAGILVSQ